MAQERNLTINLTDDITLQEVVANQPVTDFLKQINDNFEYIVSAINILQEEISNLKNNKQDKIIISTNSPLGSDGNNGDIWIVYEEESEVEEEDTPTEEDV